MALYECVSATSVERRRSRCLRIGYINGDGGSSSVWPSNASNRRSSEDFCAEESPSIAINDQRSRKRGRRGTSRPLDCVGRWQTLYVALLYLEGEVSASMTAISADKSIFEAN